MAKNCNRDGDVPITVTLNLAPEEIMSLSKYSLRTGESFDSIIDAVLKHGGWLMNDDVARCMGEESRAA
jgi:hypothetical protein